MKQRDVFTEARWGIIAVFDEYDGTLAFDVTCMRAQLFAVGKVAADGKANATWLRRVRGDQD